MIDEILKKNLEAAMRDAGTTKTRLSHDIGKAQNFIRDYLEGVKDSLKVSDVELLSKQLKIPMNELLGLPGGQNQSSHPSFEIDMEILSAVITQIEALLDEDNSELASDKKAKLIALCYKQLYTDQNLENNAISSYSVRDLISLVS